MPRPYYQSEVDGDSIGQFTGLFDKNDKELYEGDIVCAPGKIHGVVRFGTYGDEKTNYGFFIEWEKTQPYWRNDLQFWIKDIEIVGNYYENPELSINNRNGSVET